MQNTFTKKNSDIPFIQALFVQYGRFNSDNSKVSHDISSNKVLILHEQTYHLVGVLVHDGSPNSGHYFSITVCPSTGKAFLCDDLSGDEYPRLISEAMLETAVKRAFMLVFERSLNPMIEQTARKRKSEPEIDTEQVSNKSTPAQLSQERPPHEEGQQQAKADDLSAYIEEQEKADDLSGNIEEGKEEEAMDWKKSESAEESEENGSNKEEQAFCALVKEYNLLRSIPPQQRSLEQRRKYTSVAKQISRTKSKYPHIEVKKPAMTETEKKAAQRQNEDKEKKENRRTGERERSAQRRKKQDEKEKEKERAAAKERMERMRKNQDEKMKETARADDRQRKTAKKAGVTSKPRDGLKAELVLCGKFGVATNSLGKMDQVLNTLITIKIKPGT